MAEGQANPSMQWKLVDTICTLLQATTTFSASYLAGIVGFAVQTFLSNKMEWHFRGLSAVVAEDPNLWNNATLSILLLLTEMEKEIKRERLTNLFWYGSGIGVAAISISYFSHTFDMSQTDFEQRGQAYLSQIQNQ